MTGTIWRHMRRGRTGVGASAALLACVVAGALLLQTGVASAASRGFSLKNSSSHALRLESVTQVPRVICGEGSSGIHCVPAHWDMGFEGRPADGAVLKSGAPAQVWELKYAFDLLKPFTIQYAAKLTYKIEGTDGTLELVIMTTATANNSECKVIPATARFGRCTGDGLKLNVVNS
jgi:hypothetical protein